MSKDHPQSGPSSQKKPRKKTEADDPCRKSGLLGPHDGKARRSKKEGRKSAFDLISMVTKRYSQHRPPVADRGWKRPFEDPIPLPRGRQLVTLEDAGKYITKLPKAEHQAAEWQAAMEALILVATHGGPTMLARIGVMRALYRHVERVFNPDRKEPHWGKRKLKRDE